MKSEMNESVLFDVNEFDNCTFDELKQKVIDLYRVTAAHHKLLYQIASDFESLSDDTESIMTIVEALAQRAVKGGKGPLKIAPIKGLK